MIFLQISLNFLCHFILFCSFVTYFNNCPFFFSDGQKTMYHRERRKMKYLFIFASLTLAQPVICKSVEITEIPGGSADDNFDNNIIDFDEDYSLKFNKKYGSVPWHTNDKFNKDTHKYTVVKDNILSTYVKSPKEIVEDTTPSENLGVIPLELISTTENTLLSIIESTTAADLTVIPLFNAKRTVPVIEITQTVTLPSSTQSTETSTDSFFITTENDDKATTASENSETTTTKREVATKLKEIEALNKEIEQKSHVKFQVESTSTTTDVAVTKTTEFTYEPKNITGDFDTVSAQKNETKASKTETITYKTDLKETQTNATIQNSSKVDLINSTPNKTSVDEQNYKTKENKTNTITASDKSSIDEELTTNFSKETENDSDWNTDSKEDVIPFTGLDTEEVPEDYYDAKDVVPTTAPKTDALSVIFGLAGSVVESVVESVAERVVPKGIYDLFKRMQRQSEALEAERLRSREENGGLGKCHMFSCAGYNKTYMLLYVTIDTHYLVIKFGNNHKYEEFSHEIIIFGYYEM